MLDDKDIWINRAALYAATYHSGQKRKYNGKDYIIHPATVALRVSHVCPDVNVICAAWLHDTIEDTEATYEEIRDIFGEYVAKLVLEVSKVSKPEDGNRAVRKAIDREHYGKASPDGKTIKLADLLDNTWDIAKHDSKFAKVYMEEKRLLLPYLKEGDSLLYDLAQQTIDDYFSPDSSIGRALDR